MVHLDSAFYKPKLIVLTGADEIQLGLASIYGLWVHSSTLVVWSRGASSNRDFPWLQNWVEVRVIELKVLLPAEAFLVSPKVVLASRMVLELLLCDHIMGFCSLST